MALVVYDRVQETTVTTGTGSITLAGAVDGFQTFAIVGNGNTTYYCIVNGTQWEVGLGTYSTSGPTLARTTVYSNSSGTLSPITLVGGSNVFLTYPSERSVNLDATGNVTALGTVTSGAWNGSTIPVAYGGTGVATSSGANSVMLRDANQNVAINRLNQANTSTAAAGGVTALTASSSYSQTLTGTGSQTYTMPDATTLATGVAFVFNNNATGTLTLQDYASGSIGVVTSGGAVELICVSAATTGGTWDYHGFLPENVTWGTNALALGGTVITGGTWNGGTIQSGYGGTGLTTFTAANNALYSTSSSALAAGTLPVAAGGTAKTSFTANQVLYGSLSQSANLYFDGTNLGVGTSSPGDRLDVQSVGTGGININNSTAGNENYLRFRSVGVLKTQLTSNYSDGNFYFYHGGGNSIVIGNTGNVGIGTSSPSYVLDVAGIGRLTTAVNSNATSLILNNSNTAAGGVGVSIDGYSSNTSNKLAQIVFGGAGATGGNIDFLTSANGSSYVQQMRLDTSGNLLVGTTTPVFNASGRGLITINGSSAAAVGFTASGVDKGIILHTGTDMIMSNSVSGAIAFQTNNTERMRIKSDGKVIVGDVNTTSDRLFTVDTGGGETVGAVFRSKTGGSSFIGFRDNSGSISNDYTVMIGSTGNNLVSSTGNTERMRLTSTGALSFGSSGTNYGTSGQLLQSNGNASPSWIDQSSITAGSASNVAGLVANTYSTYTNIASTTAKGGFYGMLCGTGSNYPALMFDGNGGGIYKENAGFWALYYGYGTSCVGIGSSGTSAGNALQINGNAYATGAVVAASSVTSPIYYDSNPAYYGDFAGTSVVNQVYAGAMFSAINDMPRYTAGAVSGMGPATDWDNRPYVGYAGYGISYHTGVSISGYPSYGGVRLYSASYPTLAASTLRLEASTGVYTYGVFTNDSQITAPIYYDTDTTYYADFNSTSDAAIRVRGGALHGPNVTWGKYLLVGGDGRNGYINNADVASVCTTDGNLHMDSGSGHGTYLNYYDGDFCLIGAGNSSGVALKVFGTSPYTEIYGSTRSPIFYAYPNTAYYVTPDGNSNLSSALLNNYLTVDTTRATAGHGYAGSFTSRQYASSNFIPFEFTNIYGTHSWGQVARFRIDGTGGDRPSIQFSSGYTDNRWNIGYAGSDDSFRIVQNMGYRNDGTTSDGWGTPRVLIDTAGNVFNYVSTYSPIFYSYPNTGYYVQPDAVSFLFRLTVQDTNNLVWIGTSVSTSNKVGIGFNTTDLNYAIYKVEGGWTQPLRINFYTGIQIWSHSSYDYGTSFWNYNGSTKLMSVGEGDGNVRVANTLYATTAQATTMYSTVYYDSNNPAYYLNLDGYSNLGTIITGTAQFQSNYNTAGGSSPPLQAFSTGGAGAVMAFHRGGVYAINFGLDSDNIFRLGGWSAVNNLIQVNPVDASMCFSQANFIRRMNFRARELSFQNNETDDNFFFNFSDPDGYYGYNKSLIIRGLGSGGGSGHDLVSVSISATTTYVNNLSKSSGSFRIEHPLESLSETHELVHSFIEGPQIDLIYRGVVSLVNGAASVNIDLNSSMTEGTFEALCREVQCFTTNETDWTPVRGKVTGNILTIEAQDATSTASISWMVLGERKDKHIMNTNMTDEYGKLIVEPLKTERYWNYN